MINAAELRLGNYILHKSGVRILPVKCTSVHFELLGNGLAKDMFPLSLKPDILKKTGFVENMSYYQLPNGREFTLTLPVMGTNINSINAYVLNNNEPYARAQVNDLVITNNITHVHNLQNLYYALVGTELEILL